MKKITFRIIALSFAFMSLTAPVMSAIVTEPVATTSAVPDEREVNSALNELKSLSRKEKKNRLKDVKKLLKQYKADKKAGKADDETNIILLAILAILLPPLAIYLKERTLTWKFWLCIAMYVFAFVSLGFLSLPIILALLVVFDVL